MNPLLKSADSKATVAKKLAIIHNEFNVIHPFREGNGRTIRLFLDLLVGNIGYQPIDCGKKPDAEYLKACNAGASGKHGAMAQVIKKGLKK